MIADIGQRNSMEDSYQMIQDLCIDMEIPVSYFAVFDGHNGDRAAQYCKDHMERMLEDHSSIETRTFQSVAEGRYLIF